MPRVTSTDVARAAGVSQSTVSLVLSGKGEGRVAAGTREHVRATAAQLGYRPNAVARSLRTGAAHAVCLAVPDVTNPFFGRLLRSTSRAAAQAGYAVALVDTESEDSWRHPGVQTLRGAGTVAGFLLFAGLPPADARTLAEPIVLLDSEERGFSSVRLAGREGAAAAGAHLLGLGHRRIGHLRATRPGEQTFSLRASGLADALTPYGLTAREAQTTISFEAARVAALELLGGHDRPTAIFCDDDIIAGGAYLAARECGLRIPQELSVVGFDDLDHARVLDPPLTTMRVDTEAMGTAALTLLLERIAAPDGRARRLVQPVELILRGSTAKPKDD